MACNRSICTTALYLGPAHASSERDHGDEWAVEATEGAQRSRAEERRPQDRVWCVSERIRATVLYKSLIFVRIHYFSAGLPHRVPPARYKSHLKLFFKLKTIDLLVMLRWISFFNSQSMANQIMSRWWVAGRILMVKLPRLGNGIQMQRCGTKHSWRIK